MDPYECWLSDENAKEKSEEIVELIKDDIRKKTKPLTTANEQIATIATDRRIASDSMLKDWFYASVGIVDVLDEERITYFLSKSANAYVFVDHNVVSWTNWVGDLYTQVKNSILDGEYPKELEYGPQKHLSKRPIGPTVEYQFTDGMIQELRYLFGDRLPDALEDSSKDESFGLSSIIQTIDREQNEQIRIADKGAFIFMGGPGVGKTTAALHRIVYLINEQHDSEGNRIRNLDEMFFRQSNTLVLVWKEHLVPYLRECIVDLDLTEFPDENVSHIDNWINQIVRDYVSIGPRKSEYKLVEKEDGSITDLKLKLSEDHLSEFLETESELFVNVYNSLVEIFAYTSAAVAETGKRLGVGFSLPDQGALTAGDVYQLCDELLASLPKFKREDDEENHERMKSLRTRIQNDRGRALQRLSNYVKLLRDFYASDIVNARFAETSESFEEFQQAINEQFKSREITPTDKYLLAWLIYLQTKGSTSKSKGHQPMTLYSHIVVDEAQYYEPIVLRLLAELSQISSGGVLTIVGDLEQRISTNESGLADWKDIGLAIPKDKIRRLGINYRSAERVFELLLKFRECADIKELLEPPRRFLSEGLAPEIATFDNREAEFYGIARSIHEMKQLEMRKLTSVAVVVPTGLQNEASEVLVNLLKEYGINARWATQLDVKESVDQVIVTDQNSIVGLEFDSVYFACADQFFTSIQARDEINAGWVALSRAKQFLHVSRVGTDAVFDAPTFEAYKVTASEE